MTAFNRIRKQTRMMIGALCLSVAGTGCTTMNLMQTGKTWEQPRAYMGAYSHAGQLIIEYDVVTPLAESRPAEPHLRWTSASIVSTQPLKTTAPLENHRAPMPGKYRINGEPVPVLQALSALPNGETLAIKVRDPAAYVLIPVLLPVTLVWDTICLPCQFIPDMMNGDPMWKHYDDPWEHPPSERF